MKPTRFTFQKLGYALTGVIASFAISAPAVAQDAFEEIVVTVIISGDQLRDGHVVFSKATRNINRGTTSLGGGRKITIWTIYPYIIWSAQSISATQSIRHDQTNRVYTGPGIGMRRIL